MRDEIIISLLLAIPSALSFFMIMVYMHGNLAHLRRLREVIRFFFTPSPPERMLIVQSLDGKISIFYDDEFEELRTEDRVLIKTIYGDQYIARVSPSEASLVVSMFDAKAPSGYPSPFGLAWRWVVAAAIMVYFVYYAFIVSIFPPLISKEIMVGGETYTVTVQGVVDPWEIIFTSIIMTLALSFFISNLVRMNDNTIKYAWYHAVGINPPHEIITPIPGMSTLSLTEYLIQLGREIKIVIPDELMDVLKRVKEKVGSIQLAAAILAKLAMSTTWRKALAYVLREKMDLVIAGDTAARIRYGTYYGVFTRKTIVVMIIVALISFGIGYAFGNAYGFGIAPVSNTTTTTTPSMQPVTTITPQLPETTPYYPPTTTVPPPTTTTTPPATNITPAQPPPPPSG